MGMGGFGCITALIDDAGQEVRRVAPLNSFIVCLGDVGSTNSITVILDAPSRPERNWQPAQGTQSCRPLSECCQAPCLGKGDLVVNFWAGARPVMRGPLRYMLRWQQRGSRSGGIKGQ